MVGSTVRCVASGRVPTRRVGEVQRKLATELFPFCFCFVTTVSSWLHRMVEIPDCGMRRRVSLGRVNPLLTFCFILMEESAQSR